MLLKIKAYLKEKEHNMGYCFMTFQKIKTAAVMIQSFNHDYRMSAPPNADPEKKALNDIAVPVHNGSYYGEFKHKLDTLEQIPK